MPQNESKSRDELRVVLVDITERKQAEKDKERLQTELFQASKLESIGRLPHVSG